MSGKTLFIVEQKFGNDGYAFWFKLLEFIGTQDGHYLDCNNVADMEFLQAKTRLSSETIYQILDLLAGLEAIDRELWSKKGCLV
ncbi:Lin1244/Lin1753 domain-containing protein [Paraflavitalea speifideaquila]|uniref:Lin1244/Lin1753 domain-containing protein n=1 Tax=Paraflavitalea speifideaquila TaxID=3076558 RepID=UPI003312FD42